MLEHGRDVEDQYETFNGMPVYYGGDLYDLEDSDWDDPYALASAAYVEDYNFDVPEGMDLMVHRHSRIPDSLDVRQDCQMDVAPVYQTVSNATKDQCDTSLSETHAPSILKYAGKLDLSFCLPMVLFNIIHIVFIFSLFSSIMSL